jgi:hypothetical protein
MSFQFGFGEGVVVQLQTTAAGSGRELDPAAIRQGLVDECRSRLGPGLVWDTESDVVLTRVRPTAT